MINKLLKNLPNAITMSRILSSILASITFIFGNFWVSLGLYIYSAISDFFDGFAARKLNAFSEFGRKLDAISDKIFVLSLLFPTIILGNYLMLIPFVLETMISLKNLNNNKNNIRIVTERVGKFKTAMLFPTMILGLLSSKIPFLNFILIPFIGVTTELQYKTFKAYERQEEARKEEKYEEVDNNKIFCKDISAKENLINLRNELILYMYYDTNIENKPKRKERKK